MKFKVGNIVKFSEKMIGNHHKPKVIFDDIPRKIIDINLLNKFKLEDLPENIFLENELELVDFTIDDLQFADIVTTRNGKRYVVADGCLYGEDSDNYSDCDTIAEWYNYDLTYFENNKDYDIIKVERDGNVIYERKETEVKKMTVSEISKVLGYEVEIVKGE